MEEDNDKEIWKRVVGGVRSWKAKVVCPSSSETTHTQKRECLCGGNPAITLGLRCSANRVVWGRASSFPHTQQRSSNCKNATKARKMMIDMGANLIYHESWVCGGGEGAWGEPHPLPVLKHGPRSLLSVQVTWGVSVRCGNTQTKEVQTLHYTTLWCVCVCELIDW